MYIEDYFLYFELLEDIWIASHNGYIKKGSILMKAYNSELVSEYFKVKPKDYPAPCYGKYMLIARHNMVLRKNYKAKLLLPLPERSYW